MSGRKDCRCPRARHKHGTRAAYQKDGCRCFPCRLATSRIEASGSYTDEGMYVPRCGTIRRLQALHAVGWSEPDIGRRLGVTKQAVRDWRMHPSDRILAATAARVSAVYDELWDQTPPPAYRTRIVNWAARQGWLPPLAFDDEDLDDPDASPRVKTMRVAGRTFITGGFRDGIDQMVVVRLVAGGYTGPSNWEERREAVRILAARTPRLSDGQIGERLGITADAVLKTRHRHALRKESAA